MEERSSSLEDRSSSLEERSSSLEDHFRGFKYAIWIILAIWRIGSSKLEDNIGGTRTISLSEFLQNKIGMVGAYWLGFKRGFKYAIWIILAIWRIVPPIWKII